MNLGGFPGDLGAVFGTAEDEDEVDGLGDVGEGGVGFESVDGGVGGGDGEGFFAARAEKGGDVVAGARGVGGHADDGDAAGFEQRGDYFLLAGRVGLGHGAGLANVVAHGELRFLHLSIPGDWA